MNTTPFTCRLVRSCLAGLALITTLFVSVVPAQAAEPHQVNLASTTTITTITSDNPEPSVVGESVTVQYSVTPTSGSGTLTGNVTVSDGTQSCTGTVAAGQCSLIFTSAGVKSLTATYTGDANFSGSTSTAEPHQVDKANTITTITSDSPDPSVVGQSVTVQYSVAVNSPGSGTPTGNVTVSDGTVSCTATVAAGQCSLTFTSAGAKSLTATYAGDSNFNTSTSAAEAHQVNKADTTTTIMSDDPDPSAPGQAVTVQYSVVVNSPGAGTPTGNVTVSDGVDSCTGTVAAGQCTITLSTPGARTLTASYPGDSNFNTSTSAGEPHQVNGVSTTTTITSDSPDPSVVGQAVTIQYSVTPTGSGTPTGNVTVSDGTQSCTGTVAAGQCTITFTSAGAKSLTATYAGDSNFNTSTSAAEAHQVNTADTTTTITSDNPDPSSVGQAVTIQYSVAVNSPGSGIPTGNVTVSDGTQSCTGTVAGGQCMINFTSAGAKSLTATYAGDSNFNTSTSAAVTHQVNPVDMTAPDVTINQASGQADPTSSSPIHFTAFFNEPVTGFTSSDVNLSGTAGATTVVVTEIAPNDGTTYDVAVSGMTTSGTVIASIPANAATDAASNGNTASTSTDNTVTFIVGAPDLTIAKSHTGNFTQGQTGAQYTITVSNVGSGPSSGTVTVVDTLPAGLTATALSGTGWSCDSGTLTCTRSDALAAGSSYPNIILTVNVASNAPSSVTNSATVSGGSDSNTANNTANDPTTVTASGGGSGAQLVADPCDGTKTTLLVTGTSGNDTIKLTRASGGRVKVVVNNVTVGTFQPTGRIIVLGQAGNDTITLDDITLPSILYGNDGKDTITADESRSILIGGTGDDTLKGSDARDILIGGVGADKLTGNKADDILIAGSTSYDAATSANQVSLCGIQKEWSRTDLNYQGRINHLTGASSGGQNGTNFLKGPGSGQTVFDDTSKDTLKGGDGQDWFLLNRTGAGTIDTSDRSGSEIATDL